MISTIFRKIHYSIKNLKKLYYRNTCYKKNRRYGYYICELGNNHIIDCQSFCNGLHILLNGDNISVKIGKNVIINPHCTFQIEGNNMDVVIGDNIYIHDSCHFCIQEDGSRLIIGNNSMISHHVEIRTSDSHPICDLSTHERINNPKNVVIGEHTWIGSRCTILKGSVIGNGSIVGTGSIISKQIPNNVIVAGIPARVIRENIEWHGDRPFNAPPSEEVYHIIMKSQR